MYSGFIAFFNEKRQTALERRFIPMKPLLPILIALAFTDGAFASGWEHPSNTTVAD
jgi:hypothetical protein